MEKMLPSNRKQPVAVRFEKSFDGVYPVEKIHAKWNENKDAVSFDFEGTGFVLRGETAEWASTTDFVFHTQLYVDGSLIESPELPASYTTRRYELCWKYDLSKRQASCGAEDFKPINGI
jgi:hypothetical protein